MQCKPMLVHNVLCTPYTTIIDQNLQPNISKSTYMSQCNVLVHTIVKYSDMIVYKVQTKLQHNTSHKSKVTLVYSSKCIFFFSLYRSRLLSKPQSIALLSTHKLRQVITITMPLYLYGCISVILRHALPLQTHRSII